MANTFPTTLPQDAESADNGLDDVRLDRAANGDLHGRAMFTGPKREIDIETVMTAAERATLDAFYLANRVDPFDFQYKANGVTYRGLFDGMPRYRWVSAANGGTYRVSYRFVEA